MLHETAKHVQTTDVVHLAQHFVRLEALWWAFAAPARRQRCRQWPELGYCRLLPSAANFISTVEISQSSARRPRGGALLQTDRTL